MRQKSPISSAALKLNLLPSPFPIKARHDSELHAYKDRIKILRVKVNEEIESMLLIAKLQNFHHAPSHKSFLDTFIPTEHNQQCEAAGLKMEMQASRDNFRSHISLAEEAISVHDTNTSTADKSLSFDTVEPWSSRKFLGGEAVSRFAMGSPARRTKGN